MTGGALPATAPSEEPEYGGDHYDPKNGVDNQAEHGGNGDDDDRDDDVD